jgi:hypothetical protein
VSILVVPSIEKKPWPTLGDQVAAWIQAHLAFGPGDLRGENARLDEEKRALLYRMYELFPKGHPQAGRRRFRRAALSLRKGSAKSEFAAWIAAAELHPRAPVRFAGWDRRGRPLPGVGVIDPYIPLVAYTEEQSEDLVYGALRAILELSPSVRGDFDIGLERIMRVGGDGKAVALATAPDARDGARTTFQVLDETHRFTLPRLKQAHRTMLANLPKRKLADPWSLETTTAPAPGQGSVAEDTMEYAKAVAEGRAADSRFFFFHRQATEGTHDLDTEAGVRDAVVEASGPVAEWSDIEGIVDQWKDPTADRAYLGRVWLNQPVRAADRAFDFEHWKELHRKNHKVPARALIALGFDGAQTEDSTALVGTEISTGYQFRVGLWERPFGREGDDWRVPVAEVNAAVDGAFKRWDVWRLYADPPYWETVVAEWAGKYGEERVILWSTYRTRPMAHAVQGYCNAIAASELSHDGDVDFGRHIGNTFRRQLQIRDDKGAPLFAVQKERPDSPNKIDMAVAGIISWEARNDALAAGIGKAKKSVYEGRGLLTL